MGASAGFLLAQARDACGETASIKEKNRVGSAGFFQNLERLIPKG
jgi:hypothetical protein